MRLVVSPYGGGDVGVMGLAVFVPTHGRGVGVMKLVVFPYAAVASV